MKTARGQDYCGGCVTGLSAGRSAESTVSGSMRRSDRLYRFQVNGRPELNKMHTSIDMGGNNLNSAGVVNGRYGNFDVSVVSNGPVTAGGDIRSTGGWIISRHGRGWMDESHGGGFYMTDNEWIRSLNNKSIYTGGQLKGGSLRSDSDISAGGVLKLDQTSYAGTWCPQNGAISHDSSGGILSCQSGRWQKDPAVLEQQECFETGNHNGRDFQEHRCPTGWYTAGLRFSGHRRGESTYMITCCH